MKLTFRESTDMPQAMAETVGYVNRARAFMPPGTVPPFITRFDPGSIAVGLLLFTSQNHTQGELQNIALNQVRPLFATLPGVSAPPPFGQLRKLNFLRDISIAQSQRYPTADIDINRGYAGQFVLTVADVFNSLVPPTGSSRFIARTIGEILRLVMRSRSRSSFLPTGCRVWIPFPHCRSCRMGPHSHS